MNVWLPRDKRGVNSGPVKGRLKPSDRGLILVSSAFKLGSRLRAAAKGRLKLLAQRNRQDYQERG